MKRFFAFNVLVKLLLVLFITNSNAATVKGAASVYKVNMTKLELCTGSTGVTNCLYRSCCHWRVANKKLILHLRMRVQ